MGDCKCRQNTLTPGGTCVECDIPQLARNNYFTGKLLVERDFTDEQRYFLGKLRRHNQRLHGWGTVCGLKVEPHPNCPDRYVRISPGTAIDCCGREILVLNEEQFDFKQQYLSAYQAQNGPNSQPGDGAGPIQICIRYRECNAEDVPAIFDDCSHNGSACRPNRIVDGYSFEVILNPPPSNQDAPGVELKPDWPIYIESVVRAAVDTDNEKLYLLANPAAGAVLYCLDATNGSLIQSMSFSGNAALDVAVSPAGDFIYLALQPPTPTSGPQPDPAISVLKADFSAVVSTPAVTGGAGKPVRLAVAPAPDGRMLAVNPAAGALIWATDITTSATPAAPQSITPVATPSSVVVSDDGKFAYVANPGSNNVSAIALATLAVIVVPVGPGTAVPAELAVSHTATGDVLAVLDTTNSTLYLIGMQPDPSSPAALGDPVTGFTNPPAGLAISPGANWIYVAEQDTAGLGWVQSVNVQHVQLKQPPFLSGAVRAGNKPDGDIVLDPVAGRLYLPYAGDGAAVPSAVAVIDVLDTDCASIFENALGPCPDCSDGDCIVLATIDSYIYGQPLTGSMIDNLTDRHLLVSTNTLTEVVRCLLDQGPSKGATGATGATGAPGAPGAPGADGAGLEKELTRIKALSWAHGGQNQPAFIPVDGLKQPELCLVVEFTETLDISQIDPVFVFQVWSELVVQTTGTIQWSQLRGTTVPVTIQPADHNAAGLITHAVQVTGSTKGNGVAFYIQRIETVNVTVKIRLLGDFVLDAKQKAISAEFVRAQLPTGLIPAAGPFGLEGGTFESWLTFQGNK